MCSYLVKGGAHMVRSHVVFFTFQFLTKTLYSWVKFFLLVLCSACLLQSRQRLQCIRRNLSVTVRPRVPGRLLSGLWSAFYVLHIQIFFYYFLLRHNSARKVCRPLVKLLKLNSNELLDTTESFTIVSSVT